MFKSCVLAAGVIFAAGATYAETSVYELDPSHSQIVFTYDHLGFSTTTGMFSGFNGRIEFDEAKPENSQVEVSFPTSSLITGWDARTAHFLGEDFFGAEKTPEISFVSTSVEVTGKETGVIQGDLTLNGVTKPISIEARLVQKGIHPMEQKEWIGFEGTTAVLRSDFDMGMFAPYVSDEVSVRISIEGTAVQGG